MAKKYFFPDVYANEVSEGNTQIDRANTAVSMMQGIFRKGPVNKMLGPFTSLTQVENVYGKVDNQTYKLWYNIRGFFKNGGQELYLNRIAHYTDVTNTSTRTGTVASRTLSSAGGAATAGYNLASGVAAPYIMTPGMTLVADIDVAGADTATFAAVAALLECATADTYNLVAPTSYTLTCKIDGGAEQTLTITSAEYTNGAATVEEIAVSLNPQLIGGSLSVTSVGTKLTLTSDTFGSDSIVQVTGGTLNAFLGFTTAAVPSAGPNDVADISAVTFAEVKALLEADLTGSSGVTVTQDGLGQAIITSNTTGVGSSVNITGGTGLAALGFSIDPGVAGTAAGVENTLKLEFGYRGYDSPGVEPNGHLKTKVYKDPLHPSLGANLDLTTDTVASATYALLTSLEGLQVGSIIGLTDGANTEYRQLTKIEDSIVGGALQHRVEWTTGLTNVYTALTGTVESREFTIEVYWDDVLVDGPWTGLNMLDTHDSYVETILNDEATGSRWIRAVDLDSTVGLGLDIPADDTLPTAMTVAGTSEILSLTGLDYRGDETAKTGIHAADSQALLIDQVAFPGYHDPVTLHYLSQWCADKLFIFPTFAVPLGYDADTARTWRNSTLALFSKYGSLEWPGYKVYDPLSKQTRPMITITSEGHVMGLRARVDAIPGKAGGGVWSSAAGEGSFGTINDIMDLEQEVGDTEHTITHPAHINTTRSYQQGVFQRYGARTLSQDDDWKYENVTRFFMFVEKSIVQGTRWSVMRNNNFRLWSSLEDSVDTFMENLMADDAFPGENKSENWFVNVGVDKGTMDQADIDAGNVIGEVGIAANKPGEFIIWNFSQFKSGAFSISG